MDRCYFRLLTILFVSVFALSFFFLAPGISLGATTYNVPQTAEVKLAWDPNDPSPDGYRIYQRAEGQSFDYSQPCWTGSENYGTIYNLDWDTTYYFVVRAYAGASESEDSEEVSFLSPLPEPPSYSITATINGHGAISPSGVLDVIRASDKTYTIMPDTGHHVADVKVDEVSVGAVLSYTFHQVTTNQTIEVMFAVDTYKVAASAGINGSISPSGTISVDHGTSRNYIISPVAGYHVAEVVVDGESMGAINTYTFDQINSDCTIHATFAADKVASEDDTDDNDTIFTNDTDFMKIIEFGDVPINHTWTHVNFEKAFVNPVVVAGPISLNGGQPAVVRIQNVDATGFDIRIQEWNYLDGSHATETVSYLVMEQGTYTLNDGSMIEAGNRETRAAAYFEQIVFNEPFNNLPVVITTLTSFNDSDALTGRIKRIAIDGFQYRMQEQENNAPNNGAERLSFIAWEPSSGTVGDITYLIEKTANAVKQDEYCIFFDDPFASAPTFLADMQTTNGGDTANVRHANKDEFAVDVLIDEEQSWDTETDHITEVVGYMVFSRNQTDMSEAMAFGDVQINHTWTRVNFEKAFVKPVVVAGPISLNGGQPAVVRIQNVDATGFDIRIQEWDYLDGSHATETVSYLVMEQGSYTLDDGTKIEAANIEVHAANSYQQVAFREAFNVSPIVMTTLTSFNDSDAVTGRMQQISIDGYSYRMQEQQGNVQDHGAERLSYIAWEPSSGAVGDTTYLIHKTLDAVTNHNYNIIFGKPFPSSPTFLADMQTTDGGDTANIRCYSNDGASVGILIDEEQALDPELDHTTEIVGYMLFSQ